MGRDGSLPSDLVGKLTTFRIICGKRDRAGLSTRDSSDYKYIVSDDARGRKRECPVDSRFATRR
jgi:hypothetical protein